MQMNRGKALIISALSFMALTLGGYAFFTHPIIFRWAEAGQFFPLESLLALSWGFALSILLHIFWIACISKGGMTGMGRVLLRLHGFYILPCVVTLFFTYVFILRYRLEMPFPILEIVIFGIGSIFIALALYELKRGTLASRLTNIRPVLKYSLILPAGLATWFLCFLILGLFFAV